MTRIIASDSSAKKILVRNDEPCNLFKVAVLPSSPSTMNSNTAVFGICNPESSYGSGQSYSATSEHLSAFYGSQSASGTSGGSSSGGGGGSSGEPSSPSPYGGAGAVHAERHHPPETKYEPSHSPTSGIISSDNGLQYANLDGSELKGYSGYPGAAHPHQAYQAHHSLVQATYAAHHYGKLALSLPLSLNLLYNETRTEGRNTVCLSLANLIIHIHSP